MTDQEKQEDKDGNKPAPDPVSQDQVNKVEEEVVTNSSGLGCFPLLTIFLFLVIVILDLAAADMVLIWSTKEYQQLEQSYQNMQQFCEMAKNVQIVVCLAMLVSTIAIRNKIQFLRMVSFLFFSINIASIIKILTNQATPMYLYDLGVEKETENYMKLLDGLSDCRCLDGKPHIGAVFVTFTCFSYAFYLGKYGKSQPRTIFFYNMIVLAFQANFYVCVFYMGEGSALQLGLSFSIAFFIFSLEVFLREDFDRFVFDLIQKELEKEDSIADRAILITICVYTDILLGIVLLFVKWMIFMDAADNKDCKDINDNNFDIFQAERSRMFILSTYPYFLLVTIHLTELEWKKNEDYYKENKTGNLIVKWFIKFIAIALLAVVYFGFQTILIVDIIGGIIVTAMSAWLFIKGSIKIGNAFNLWGNGDIIFATVTIADKKKALDQEAERAKKEKEEKRKKQKRSDFKMGTQEFKDDALPSKNVLERVDSPFGFGECDSPSKPDLDTIEDDNFAHEQNLTEEQKAAKNEGMDINPMTNTAMLRQGDSMEKDL